MPYNGFNLDNMVAFITGGGRGIGKAVALGMAEAGAGVAVCEIPDRMDLATQTVEDVKKLGKRSNPQAIRFSKGFQSCKENPSIIHLNLNKFLEAVFLRPREDPYRKF